jgi:hypothetical protein
LSDEPGTRELVEKSFVSIDLLDFFFEMSKIAGTKIEKLLIEG